MRRRCETIRANDLRDGYIRLVVTRGSGTNGSESVQVSETVD